MSYPIWTPPIMSHHYEWKAHKYIKRAREDNQLYPMAKRPCYSCEFSRAVPPKIGSLWWDHMTGQIMRVHDVDNTGGTCIVSLHYIHKPKTVITVSCLFIDQYLSRSPRFQYLTHCSSRVFNTQVKSICESNPFMQCSIHKNVNTMLAEPKYTLIPDRVLSNAALLLSVNPNI